MSGEPLPVVRAYTVPYSTYRLTLCLRCAKPYPDGPDKQPVTDADLGWFAGCCDRCHVPIPKGGPGQ